MFTKAIPAAGSTGDCVFDPADAANSNAQNCVSGLTALRPVDAGPAPSIVRPRGGLIL